MPDKLNEVERNIALHRKEAEKDREDRAHAARVIHRKDAAIEDVAKAVDKVNGQLDRRRRIQEKIEDDPEFKGWTEERRQERLDELADAIEELAAYRDRALARIDEAREEKHEAKIDLRKYDRQIGQHRKRIDALQERRRRIKARAQEDVLTDHFVVAEFDCRDGTDVPKGAIPALKAWCQEYGEDLRGRFGTVHVNSGYRTRGYNASIGGATNSIHIYDAHTGAVAVDFTCERGSPSEWASFLESRADGLGRYASFIHADNRNRIGWPTSRWSG